MAVPLQKPPLRSTRRSEYNKIESVTEARKNKRARSHDEHSDQQQTPKKLKTGHNLPLSRPIAKSKSLNSPSSFSKVIPRVGRFPPSSPKAAAPTDNLPKVSGLSLSNAEQALQLDSKPHVNGVSSSTELKNEQSPKKDRRILRSQDGGSRAKSELAQYFPCYDELLSLDSKPTELLTAESTLFVVDDKAQSGSKGTSPISTPTKGRQQKLGHNGSPGKVNGVKTKPNKGFDINDLVNAQRLDFTSIVKSAPQLKRDPLTDKFFHDAHRRPERQEKQLRNIEREHAQHEKSQLERLLDGLRGHDWLRIMGISGITESEKKEFEPKRDWFISEVQGLIEKFRVWKEEEKRRKVARDQKIQAEEDAAAEEEDEEEGGEEEDGAEGEEADDHAASYDEEQRDDDAVSDGDPPDWSDIDADEWAARQLQLEASSASRPHHSTAPLPPPPPPPREKSPDLSKPFLSFYDKPHLRAAAVGNYRRSGRSVSAFGKPLPELHPQDFALPEDLLTPEAMRASARARRANRRKGRDG